MATDDSRGHIKEWSPMYVLLLVLGGGGGTAVLTDNLPMTRSEFIEHESGMHVAAEDQFKQINSTLTAIELDGVRKQLRDAYKDKCKATGDLLAYVDRDIERLQQRHVELTATETMAGVRYIPPPCTGDT